MKKYEFRVTANRGNYRAKTSTVRVADIVVEIDIDEIVRRLGQKAAFAKSKKSVGLGGAVTVRRVSVVSETTTATT